MLASKRTALGNESDTEKQPESTEGFVTKGWKALR